MRKESFNKAIELNPNYAGSYFFRGVHLTKDRIFLKAIDDFNKTIELNPNYTEAYLYRGTIKGNLGDEDGACLDLKKAKELGNQIANKLIKELCE